MEKKVYICLNTSTLIVRYPSGHKEVVLILGYSNPQKALRDHVDEEDRTVNESFTVNGTFGTKTVVEMSCYAMLNSEKARNFLVLRKSLFQKFSYISLYLSIKIAL